MSATIYQFGLTRTFEYDQAGRLIAVELPGVYNPATSQIESPRYEYGYDAQGNQTLLRDPLGRETWFTFDAQNRQVSRTLPLGFGEDGIRGTGDDPVEWTSSSILPPDMPFTERTKRTERKGQAFFAFFCLQFGAWGATIMIVMHFQRGRISDDGGSKSTRGCERNSLLPLHFSLREEGFFVRRGI